MLFCCWHPSSASQRRHLIYYPRAVTRSLYVPPVLWLSCTRGKRDNTRRAVSWGNSCKSQLYIWKHLRNTENSMWHYLFDSVHTVLLAHLWTEFLWNDSSFYLTELKMNRSREFIYSIPLFIYTHRMQRYHKSYGINQMSPPVIFNVSIAFPQ